MFDLSNKTAIITGGGSGIGAAIAIMLASQRATVYILDRDYEAANKTAEKIKESSGLARPIALDVTDLATIKQTIDTIESTNPIEILVNNAGIGHIGNVETTLSDDLDRLFAINVKGYYHLVHAVIPYMKVRKKGNIINIASVAGTVGISDRFAYSMTKGAVLAMSRSIAKDYIGHGIRCNTISPGRVHTPFVDGYLSKNYPGREQEMFEKLAKTQPIGRMGLPNEIAALALYLASDESAFITGTDFPIDGGFITLNS
jgi:2-keto-3-deoxy-L-fuconate dehydrogenase